MRVFRKFKFIIGLAALMPLVSMPLAGDGYKTADTGDEHVLIIGESNTLWSWGSNSDGQLGVDNDITQSSMPVRVTQDIDWQVVAAGATHSVAIKKNGTIYSWGSNSKGELGLGDMIPRSIPTQIGTDNDWAGVLAGNEFTIAIKTDGRLYGMGNNTNGQLGVEVIGNESDYRLIPVLIDDLNTYSDISLGVSFVLAIRNGNLVGWGSNVFAQLGLGTTDIYRHPTLIDSSHTWESVEAGSKVSYGIADGGHLYSWGFGTDYLLGIGSNSVVNTPSRVGTDSDWSRIEAGALHTLAIKTDGTLWGWGANNYGELGFSRFDAGHNLIIENIQIKLPRQIGQASDWSDVTAGTYFTLLEKSDGTILAMGRNSVGQLGNGTTLDSDIPTENLFGHPDLTIANISLDNTSVLVLGEEVTLRVTVTNNGTTSVPENSNVQAQIYFSKDTIVSDDDILLSGDSVNLFSTDDSIGVGLSEQITAVVRLPAEQPFGNYYFVGTVDPLNAIEESLENNNDGYSLLSHSLEVDLRVSLIDVSYGGNIPPLRGGDPIYLQYEVFNGNDPSNLTNIDLGDLPANSAGNFKVQVILSETISANAPGALLIAEYTVPDAINLGTSFSPTTAEAPLEILLPAHIPNGNYYLILNLLPESSVPDKLVENNIAHTSADSLLEVDGISYADALDNPVYPPEEGDPVEIEFLSVDDSPQWFGQEVESYNNQGDALQTPPMKAGQTATFTATIPGPSVIRFRWKIDAGSENNYLAFLIAGQEADRISGTQVWNETQTTYILPAATNFVSWNYHQVTDPAVNQSDRALVDAVVVERASAFDFVVDSVEYEGGVFVPNSDNLKITVLARNNGVDIETLNEDFVIKAYLSDDERLGADDYLWETLERFPPGLEPDDRFGFAVERIVPEYVRTVTTVDPDTGEEISFNEFTTEEPTLENGVEVVPRGAYYLIIVVDANDVYKNERNEDDNIFISETNNIFIDPRPDLVPDAALFTIDTRPDETAPDPEPALLLIGDTVVLDFTINNEGIVSWDNNPYRINVVLSSDREFGDLDDFALFSIEEKNSIEVGGSKHYTASVDIPTGVPLGKYLYLGIVVDADNALPEANEDNNTAGNNSQDEIRFIFSEGTLKEALFGWDFEEEDGDLTDGEPSSFTNYLHQLDPAQADAPWYAQSDDTFDNETAVRSVGIGNNQTAAFEFNIKVPGNSTKNLTWAWKVSCEALGDDEGTGADNTYDSLQFIVDNEDIFYISGLLDWRVQTYKFENLGADDKVFTVKYEYRKDGLIRVGQDCGWVDILSDKISDLDFNFDPLETVASNNQGIFLQSAVPQNGFSAGDPLSIEVAFENAGTLSTSPQGFVLELRLTSTTQWDHGDVFPLGQFRITDPIKPQEVFRRTYEVLIPESIPTSGDFFLAAKLDVDDEISEDNEGNNEEFNSYQSPYISKIHIEPLVELPEALDFDPAVGWQTGGTATWFGQETVFNSNRPKSSAAQATGIGSFYNSYIETVLKGPGELTFDVAYSIVENDDFLVCSVDGIEKLNLTGSSLVMNNGIIDNAQSWKTFTVFVPAGEHPVRWFYDKNSADDLGSEAANRVWLDYIRFQPITKPDLVIKEFSVTGGNYILESADPDRDKLPIQVVVENQGYTSPDLSNFEPSDIEIVLSGDQEYGNEDDIKIGNFSQTDIVLGTQQVILDADLYLPHTTPPGNYYVLTQVNYYQNQNIVEYDDTNNSAVTSEKNVTVIAAPNLILNSVLFDSSRNYFPEDPFHTEFSISNKGLEATFSDTTFHVTVTLYQGGNFIFVAPGEILNDADNVEAELGFATPITELTSFPISTYMSGRDDLHLDGSTLDFILEATLPTKAQILEALDFIDVDLKFLSFFLLFSVDDTNAVTESDEENLFIYGTEISMINPFTGPETYDDWTERYDGVPKQADATPETAPTADIDGDGLSNIEEYAFNLNPLYRESGVTVNIPDFVEIDNEYYLSLTFNLNKFAQDLTYSIEVARIVDPVNGPVYSNILDISPPFLDLTGPGSLTDTGGLITLQEVVAISDMGYHARITVRDIIADDGTVPVKFMRIKVQLD